MADIVGVQLADEQTFLTGVRKLEPWGVKNLAATFFAGQVGGTGGGVVVPTTGQLWPRAY